jgi:putative DNA primase/helicase
MLLKDASDAIIDAIDGAEEMPPAPDNAELAKCLMADDGNADRLIARFGRDLCYTDEKGWLAWNGQYWDANGGNAIARLCAKKTARAIFDEADALGPFDEPEPPEAKKRALWQQRKERHGRKRSALRKWALASCNRARIENMIALAEPELRRSLGEFNCHPLKIVARNCTLDLSRGIEAYPHRRSDMSTLMMNADYDPDTDCPRWRQFIREIQPEPEIQYFLRKWFGYQLCGHTGLAKTLILHGEGRNGKGVLVEVLAHVFGLYAAYVDISTWLDEHQRSGSGPTPDLACLPGIRFVSTSESPPGARLDEARIKQWTGGDRVKARELQRPPFEFIPQCKITFSVNPLPKIVGKDRAIKSRIVIVPFEQFFPETPDDSLKEELKREASGILNWLLDGWSDFREEDFLMPDKLQARWCRESGTEPAGQKAVGKRLDDLNMRRQKIGGKYWLVGYRIKDEWMADRQCGRSGE